MPSYLWTAQAWVCVDRDQQSKAILPEKRSPHIQDERCWCTKKCRYFTSEMLQNHSHCAWTQWGFISTNSMTASPLKTKFHLNTNAGIVLTLQCRVLSLPLSAQPPYKFPLLLLWPHIPKLSLAGNYMHFNGGNKKGLTNILLQWDLKSGLWMLSSPDDILS